MTPRKPAGDERQAGRQPEPLHQLIYVSQLVPGAPGETLPEVLRMIGRARQFNAEAGITGLLVFDGECFSQFIEGEESGLLALYGRILVDTRHRAVTTVYAGAATRRSFPGFSVGFANAVTGDLILQLSGRRGQPARELFMARRTELDIG